MHEEAQHACAQLCDHLAALLARAVQQTSTLSADEQTRGGTQRDSAAPSPSQQHTTQLINSSQPTHHHNPRPKSGGSSTQKRPPPPPPPRPPSLFNSTPSIPRVRLSASPLSIGKPGAAADTPAKHTLHPRSPFSTQSNTSGAAGSQTPITPNTTPPSSHRSPATPGSEHRVLHWEALPPNQFARESVWRNPLTDVLNVRPVSKVELFMHSQAPTPPLRIRSAHSGSRQQQQLLDSTTSNNLLIVFQNTTPQALSAAIEGMDRSVLTASFVQQCLSVLSKQTTVDAVMGWVKQPGKCSSKLGRAEAFVHALASTPDARLRLEVLRLSHAFQEDLPRKMADAACVHAVCERLLTCLAWRRLLHHLLETGNTINAHKGVAAAGFRLSSLEKFVDMRTHDKRLSLLDAVVEALELDVPRHVDDLISLEPLLAAAKEVDLKHLKQETDELEKGLAKVSTFLELLETQRTHLEKAVWQHRHHPQPQTEQEQQQQQSHTDQQQLRTNQDLTAVWTASLTHWQEQVQKLRSQLERSSSSVRDVAQWHCEPVTGKLQWELQHSCAWLDNLHRFILQVKQSAHKTRTSLAQMERQKLQKQASAPPQTPTTSKSLIFPSDPSLQSPSPSLPITPTALPLSPPSLLSASTNALTPDKQANNQCSSTLEMSSSSVSSSTFHTPLPSFKALPLSPQGEDEAATPLLFNQARHRSGRRSSSSGSSHADSSNAQRTELHSQTTVTALPVTSNTLLADRHTSAASSSTPTSSAAQPTVLWPRSPTHASTASSSQEATSHPPFPPQSECSNSWGSEGGDVLQGDAHSPQQPLSYQEDQQQQQQQQQQGDLRDQQQHGTGRVLVVALQDLLNDRLYPSTGAGASSQQLKRSEVTPDQLLLATTRLSFSAALHRLQQAPQQQPDLAWPKALITSAGTQIWLRHDSQELQPALKEQQQQHSPPSFSVSATASSRAEVPGCASGSEAKESLRSEEHPASWCMLREWESHFTRRSACSPEFNDVVQHAMHTAAAKLSSSQDAADAFSGAADATPGCQILCGPHTGSAHLVSALVHGSHAHLQAFVAQLRQELHTTCQAHGLQVHVNITSPVPDPCPDLRGSQTNCGVQGHVKAEGAGKILGCERAVQQGLNACDRRDTCQSADQDAPDLQGRLLEQGLRHCFVDCTPAAATTEAAAAYLVDLLGV